MTPEELDNLQKLLSGAGINPAAAPPVSPPPVDAPYRLQSDQYLQQASDLDKQGSQEYPAPHGVKEHAVDAIRAAMESFGRYGAPGGYEGQEAQRRKQFTEQQNSRFDRAKDLRAMAYQQQALGETAKSREQNYGIAQSNLEETKKLREIQERDAATREQQANRPVIGSVPAGTTQIVRDPVTGKLVDSFTASSKAVRDAHVGGYVNKAGKRVEIFQKEDGDVYEREFGDVREQAMRSTGNEPGSYIPFVNDQGVVTGAWNPKSGQAKQIPAEIQGARKTAVPAAVNAKVTDLENSFRKIQDLGSAYKPEFVGPSQGVYERSKATGVLSHLPFLTSPEGYGEFLALNADLKNSVIKLITGAQMGQQEAQRILQQVPVETDKPEIWAAKYEQTRRNAEYLLNHTKERSGLDQQPQNAGGGGNTTDAVRARLGLPPKGR